MVGMKIKLALVLLFVIVILLAIYKPTQTHNKPPIIEIFSPLPIKYNYTDIIEIKFNVSDDKDTKFNVTLYVNNKTIFENFDPNKTLSIQLELDFYEVGDHELKLVTSDSDNAYAFATVNFNILPPSSITISDEKLLDIQRDVTKDYENVPMESVSLQEVYIYKIRNETMSIPMVGLKQDLEVALLLPGKRGFDFLNTTGKRGTRSMGENMVYKWFFPDLGDRSVIMTCFDNKDCFKELVKEQLAYYLSGEYQENLNALNNMDEDIRNAWVNIVVFEVPFREVGCHTDKIVYVVDVHDRIISMYETMGCVALGV